MNDDESCQGRWWSRQGDGRIRCELCPRECLLREGQRGFCFVRQVKGGTMVLTTYGRSTGFCIDPIEKKPLNHFYPGSSILSFGTAGCNLGCQFCQNWGMSRSRTVAAQSERASPENIALRARELGCKSVAFTYNDPTIFAEYAIDTARACHEHGLLAVAVTNGYIQSPAREEFYGCMDAVNIDLKAFSDGFYRKLTFARLNPVLETLEYVARETNVWLEITTLLIPGQNDDDTELRAMCQFPPHQLFQK